MTKTRFLQVRVDEEDLVALHQLAGLRKTTASALVRAWMHQGIKTEIRARQRPPDAPQSHRPPPAPRSAPSGHPPGVGAVAKTRKDRGRKTAKRRK